MIVEEVAPSNRIVGIADPLFLETLAQVEVVRAKIGEGGVRDLQITQVESIARALSDMIADNEAIHVYARKGIGAWHHVPNTPLRNPRIETESTFPRHFLLVRADPHHPESIRYMEAGQRRTLTPISYEHLIPAYVPREPTHSGTKYFIGHDSALFIHKGGANQVEERLYLAGSLLTTN